MAKFAVGLLVAAAVAVSAHDRDRLAFHTEANYIRVPVYPTLRSAPVLGLTQNDVAFLEDNVPQHIDRFTHVEIRTTGLDARRDPANAAQSQQPAAKARQSGCNAPLDAASVTIPLPSNPFAVEPTTDGCWVFASVGGASGGIVVLKRGGGRIEMALVVPVSPALAGVALTHDGKLLIAAANDSAVVLDVDRMTAGAPSPILGTFNGAHFAGSVYVNVTADDKLVFVSEEGGQSITVIDLQRARQNGYTSSAILGDIPAGRLPIALTFSPDGKWLYTTSELAGADWGWPRACKPEGSTRTDLVNPEGAVIVVDVARARTDPSHAVAARIPAGCSPVRMAMSPGGGRIYVTARNNNAVEAFDTAKLVSDSDHARVGMTPVGEAPVPVAVIDGGKKVVVGNSNRFAGGGGGETLTVVDAAKLEEKGADATLGTISSGAFPREFSVSADGHTLFLTNAGSRSLQVIDIDRLPVER